jgi:anti-anti-sigma factor
MDDMPGPQWPGLTIDRTGDSTRALLMLAGELDLATVSKLEKELCELDGASPRHYLIDLGELEFMDSSGLAALIRAQISARTNGHTLAFRRPSRQVERLLEVTGLRERLSFED